MCLIVYVCPLSPSFLSVCGIVMIIYSLIASESD